MPDDTTQTFQVGDLIRFFNGTMRFRVVGINGKGTLFCQSFTDAGTPSGPATFGVDMQSQFRLVQPAQQEAPHDA